MRFPTLLAIIGSLFLVDLAVPDLVPLADEILLGLLTVLLASVRKRKTQRGGGPIVEPAPEITDRAGGPPTDR